ncbi:MAG: ABC transporter ATP-binding protein [Spirochaetaceae bacterium]
MSEHSMEENDVMNDTADRHTAEAAQERPLLELRNLYVNFYTYRGVVKAINGIHLSLRQGEFFGLVGETGCGKSVTGSSILNLIRNPGRIESGEIHFKGRDLLKISEEQMRREIRGKEITMIMQHPVAALNPVMPIEDQLAEAIRQRKGTSDVHRRSIDMLSEVNIPDPEKILRRYPHQLSGGMAQRVMIAMMLATEPALLIADEPTTALDVSVQAQVLNLLKRLIERHNSSVLLITHDMSVVSETCERVAVMYAGDIIEVGEVEEVIFDPKHPYTQGLMQAIPTEERDELEGIPGTVPELVDPPPGCRFHPRCPHAMDICKEKKPPERNLGGGHLVACWLYEQ